MQFGFRKDRSATDNLTILTTDIRRSFMKGQYCGVLFLDVNKAFDSVQPDILLRILKSFDIPDSILYTLY